MYVYTVHWKPSEEDVEEKKQRALMKVHNKSPLYQLVIPKVIYYYISVSSK